MKIESMPELFLGGPPIFPCCHARAEGIDPSHSAWECPMCKTRFIKRPDGAAWVADIEAMKKKLGIKDSAITQPKAGDPIHATVSDPEKAEKARRLLATVSLAAAPTDESIEH
jgi:hypothetical protein